MESEWTALLKYSIYFHFCRKGDQEFLLWPQFQNIKCLVWWMKHVGAEMCSWKACWRQDLAELHVWTELLSVLQSLQWKSVWLQIWKQCPKIILIWLTTEAAKERDKDRLLGWKLSQFYTQIWNIFHGEKENKPQMCVIKAPENYP